MIPSRKSLGRIGRQSDFRRVLSSGKRADSRLFAARVLQRGDDDQPSLRLGVLLPRHFAKAVKRNLVRRRLREACRRRQPDRGSWDVVLIPKPACLEAEYGAIVSCVEDVFRRIGVYSA